MTEDDEEMLIEARRYLRGSVSLTLGEIGRMVAAAYPGTEHAEVELTLQIKNRAEDTRVIVSWEKDREAHPPAPPPAR